MLHALVSATARATALTRCPHLALPALLGRRRCSCWPPAPGRSRRPGPCWPGCRPWCRRAHRRPRARPLLKPPPPRHPRAQRLLGQRHSKWASSARRLPLLPLRPLPALLLQTSRLRTCWRGTGIAPPPLRRSPAVDRLQGARRLRISTALTITGTPACGRGDPRASLCATGRTARGAVLQNRSAPQATKEGQVDSVHRVLEQQYMRQIEHEGEPLVYSCALLALKQEQDAPGRQRPARHGRSAWSSCCAANPFGCRGAGFARERQRAAVVPSGGRWVPRELVYRSAQVRRAALQWQWQHAAGQCVFLGGSIHAGALRERVGARDQDGAQERWRRGY